MTFRVLLVVAGAACTTVVPLHAQKGGSVEVGAFTAYMNADNSLPVGNGLGFGARAGVNATPWLAVEVDVASVSKNGAKHSPLHVWLNYNIPPTSNSELFVGIGYVRNSYSGSYDAKDSGIGGQVGLRQRMGKTLALRIDGHADFMSNAANKSYLISYNGNWAVGVGVSALLNR